MLTFFFSSLSQPLSFALTLRNTHPLSHIHTHSLSHWSTHSFPSFSLSYTPTHTYTHKHAHNHTHSFSFFHVFQKTLLIRRQRRSLPKGELTGEAEKWKSLFSSSFSGREKCLLVAGKKLGKCQTSETMFRVEKRPFFFLAFDWRRMKVLNKNRYSLRICFNFPILCF